jgi:hypothetical protein
LAPRCVGVVAERRKGAFRLRLNFCRRETRDIFSAKIEVNRLEIRVQDDDQAAGAFYKVAKHPLATLTLERLFAANVFEFISILDEGMIKIKQLVQRGEALAQFLGGSGPGNPSDVDDAGALAHAAEPTKLDAIDDLSLLAMECEHLGRDDIAKEIMADYRLATFDAELPSLWAF